MTEPNRDAALSALSTTARILGSCPHRLPGSDTCRAAAHHVADRLRLSCDNVREEPFTLHPGALWHLGRILAVISVAGAVLLMAGQSLVLVAAALCLVGLAYGLSQYVFYGTTFDGLFPKAEGINVVAVLEPSGPAEKQVVLVGHHDGPWIFSFLERFPRIAFPRFILGMAGYLAVTGYAVWMAVGRLGGSGPAAARGAGLWIAGAAAVCAAQLFFMMSRRPSPGAGDNLNATSMNAEIAGFFKAERAAPLRRTRLILLSTDGEEAGQRGAIAFVKRHGKELRSLPTTVLNLDSIYQRRHLAVLTRDRNGTCALSRAMVDDLCGIAAAHGIALRRMPIPFGGGGTDAAAFAVAGIEATTIIAQPTGMFSGDHLYHTSRDIVENIEVEAVEAVLRLAAAYVRKVDSDERR